MNMDKKPADMVHMAITEEQTYDPRSLLSKVAILGLSRLRDRGMGTPGSYLPSLFPTPQEEQAAHDRWKGELTTAIDALTAYVDDENFMDEAVDEAAQEAFLWIAINLDSLWD